MSYSIFGNIFLTAGQGSHFITLEVPNTETLLTCGFNAIVRKVFIDIFDLYFLLRCIQNNFLSIFSFKANTKDRLFTEKRTEMRSCEYYMSNYSWYKYSTKKIRNRYDVSLRCQM